MHRRHQRRLTLVNDPARRAGSAVQVRVGDRARYRTVKTESPERIASPSEHAAAFPVRQARAPACRARTDRRPTASYRRRRTERPRSAKNVSCSCARFTDQRRDEVRAVGDCRAVTASSTSSTTWRRHFGRALPLPLVPEVIDGDAGHERLVVHTVGPHDLGSPSQPLGADEGDRRCRCRVHPRRGPRAVGCRIDRVEELRAPGRPARSRTMQQTLSVLHTLRSRECRTRARRTGRRRRRRRRPSTLRRCRAG